MSSAEARDLHWWKRVEVRSVVDDAVEKKKVVRKRSGGFGFRRGNNISIVAVAVVAADFKLPIKPVCIRA